MSKIVVSEMVTLDGVMEAPGGEPGHPHTGWVIDFQGEEQIQHKYEEVLDAEALLIGRVTYESFAGAWPHYEGEFADRMNAMPKYVVSTTLRDPGWTNARVISGDVIAGITKLKEQAGGPLVVGGSLKLVQTLMAHDLIDEYRLMIFPVVLGSGRRLFPESPDKLTLRLTNIRAFDSGVVEYTYQPANRPADGQPGVPFQRSAAHPVADHSGIDCGVGALAGVDNATTRTGGSRDNRGAPRRPVSEMLTPEGMRLPDYLGTKGSKLPWHRRWESIGSTT